MECQYTELRLADVITEEMLVEGLAWVNGGIGEAVGYREGDQDEDQEKREEGEGEEVEKRVNKTVDKKLVIAYL